MKTAVIKIGGKAQDTRERFESINRQVVEDYLSQGCKAVLLPSAMGSRTDELLAEARETGICSGGELSHFLVHNGEEESGISYRDYLKGLGLDAAMVRPEDECFFLYGRFSNRPYDSRNMEFVTDGEGFLNCLPDIDASLERCGPFLEMLEHRDIVIVTAWAVSINGRTGLIKGRGGSDSSLVGVSEVLRRAGKYVEACTKITDVECIYDSEGVRMEKISAGELISILGGQGKWPVQRYALEQMGSDSVLGVAPWWDINRIGTYIFGAPKGIQGGI